MSTRTTRFDGGPRAATVGGARWTDRVFGARAHVPRDAVRTHGTRRAHRVRTSGSNV